MPRYTLMNKDTAVLEFDYDEELHAATKITAVINPSYAPLAIVNAQGEITRRALNSWWQSRAIPATRQQIHQVLDELSLDSTL
ncbi:MAG: DNA-binding protein, partial [Raoultibacter sp.]